MLTRPDAGATASFPTIRHILVPLDGSESAEGVLAPAAQFARGIGARLTLVRVVPLVTDHGLGVFPLVQHELTRARTYLDDVAADLRDEGLDVAIRAVFGNTAPSTIAQIADACEADLIALASHGDGGREGTRLGSLADLLLGATSRPVLIVRPAIVA
jgi:nucleotide-binding universal stress UspA family protein